MTDILHSALHAMADATDEIVPGAGESYRKFADENYGNDIPETDLIVLAEREVIAKAKALVGKNGQLDYVCFETAFDISSARAAQELCEAVALLESREALPSTKELSQ